MRLIDADALMKKTIEKFYITNYFNHITDPNGYCVLGKRKNNAVEESEVEE